jgi:hypothetical protein
MADTPHCALVIIGLVRIAFTTAHGHRQEAGFPPRLVAPLPRMRGAALGLTIALVALAVSPTGLQAGERRSADSRISSPRP